MSRRWERGGGGGKEGGGARGRGEGEDTPETVMSGIISNDHPTLLTLFSSKLLLHIASKALEQNTAIDAKS